ncbi:endo-1,3-beta glucanase [Scheffersomyces xylosifermentans]|uniref:endo-1,3-beta glucanase n=1 Tax=Scheffersomyces xylosifermentans TaxID=1304137 RepID=UPI00315C5B84
MGFLRNALKNLDLKDQTQQRQPEQQQPPPQPQRKQQVFSHSDQDNSRNFDIGDIFSHPIAEGEPPAVFKRVQHNQKPQGCSYGDDDEAIHTNNFYNNLTLDDQTFPVWTLPYSLWLTKDPDQDAGLAFNHTEAAQRVFGPDAGANPAQFYFNPPKIKSFVISGEGIKNNVSLTLKDHNKLSVIATLASANDKFISIPLAHGMGFITATYNNIKPIIASQVGFQEFTKVGNVGNISKYKAKLFNQVVWSVYVDGDVALSLKDPNHVVGDKETNATIQFARGESQYYDQAAGTYPVAVDLKGSVKGTRGQYRFDYKMQGKSQSGTGLVWCLPHHQEALVDDVKNKYAQLELDSPTKGVMRAYATNELIMEEDLPVDINWEPWASFSNGPSYSDKAKEAIKRAAEEEVKQDVVGMADIDSMYTSGKILDKFAYIAYVTKFILNDEDLTSKVVPLVKKAVEIFANNKQKYPLVYDTTWKGLISSADPGADFGNSNYNDHHFHYGYHIHAIALIAKIDKDWLTANNNLVLNYANTLLRDTANPQKEKYFPQSRSFDWFHGHSFAHGIFASGDGKDEESSSEDYHFAYGMKLYAKVIGDSEMESRANLILAIMKRAMNMYMLYSDDNKIQPPNFIKNKVAGISFENKIDFSTYFGRGTIADEWIHGIHMLPITPISSYIRSEKFVKEEWDQKLANIIDQIPDGWKGILMLNSALFDPKKAWTWFARNDWEDRLIDNGMSRTWSLAYIAGIGGAD